MAKTAKGGTHQGPNGATIAQIDEAANLVSLFFDRADVLGDLPFLYARHDGQWHSLSWREVARRVVLLAESLRSLGLNHGDRVALVSENRPEWCIADLAIMAAGLVSVPAYTTNTTADHLHVLENCGARAVFVSNAKLAKLLLPAVINSPAVEHVIAFEPIRQQQAGTARFHALDDLVTGNVELARTSVEMRLHAVKREAIACIIYTSGTGGAPRGVRQHHGAILMNCAGAARIIAEDFGWDHESFLSFLPLSHSYEHTGGQFLPICLGATIHYAEGLDKLAANIEEVRPTVMVVVPRLFEVLRARILKQLAKQGKAARTMAQMAVALAERQSNERTRPVIDAIEDAVLEKVLRPRIRARFGGRIKAMVSGGAPLNPEIGYFFTGLGLPLLQGYGQTESGPIICVSRPSAGLKMDSVGPPIHGAEVRIADDGEILARGEMVMHGYWQNEAETAKALVDGWLHTGDIGHFDARGRIVITDRKKDMIVNDKGDNIAPQRVEGMLTLQPEIAQAMVSGDRKPYIVGLIVPDAEWSREWARDNNTGADWETLSGNADFRAAVRAAVDRVNADLSVIEKVRRFEFADEPFSIENHEMTPSLKIRRHKIRDRYADRVAGMYKS
ncbi:long-chain fatty acid--CoA ligase [Croceicoccus ponticola]|uniref:Long-chain fatty acid--CoA ligase n=1 Tax=Croceicoccus ponticola TaxID=2217664 RepID=A0A437GYB8_9SPHN|nr:long-chain fatty acid--CoA ligase [Croceicoccus ponticola]RVQ67663.1 long-chain fatty acid--CoA ligase [Croceicoccus ponticola]